MILGLGASIYVHTAGEDFVDLGEAEASVQGGAFEGRAVSGEGDALWDMSAASEFDFGSDTVSLQVIGEVFPAVWILQGGFDYNTLQPDKLNILPPTPEIEQLWKEDYRRMRDTMIYGESVEFDELIKMMRVLMGICNEN